MQGGVGGTWGGRESIQQCMAPKGTPIPIPEPVTFHGKGDFAGVIKEGSGHGRLSWSFWVGTQASSKRKGPETQKAM